MGPTAPFVAIDFETANEDPTSACAVGLALVRDGKVVRVTSRLIRPPTQEFEFSELHGITWRDVEDEPIFADVWRALLPELEEASFLAAHNARFDRRVLQACCREAGLVPPRMPFVCTMQLARKVWRGPVGLADLCRRLDIPLRHHDPASDAEACARVLIEFAIKTGDGEVPTGSIVSW